MQNFILTVDGDTVTVFEVCETLAANYFDKKDIVAVRQLQPGQVLKLGALEIVRY